MLYIEVLHFATMATKARYSVFRHFAIPDKVEGNFKAKCNYCPATLSQIHLCLLYISRFCITVCITVWKTVEMKMYLYLKYFPKYLYLYLNTLVVKVFEFVFFKINVFVFVLKYISMYLTPMSGVNFKLKDNRKSQRVFTRPILRTMRF